MGALRGDRATLATQTVAAPDWTQAVLLLVFAYGGFEAAVIAASETERPRQDTAFALLAAMGLVTLVYGLVQLAVVAVLPLAAVSKAPLADALRVTLGPTGAALGGLAAVLSAYGWLTGFTLLMPRVLHAMAERGEVPRVLQRVHPEYRTPDLAIGTCAVAVLAFGLLGTFTATATLAAIARLLVFAITCAALVALRRRPDAAPAGFTLPGGPVWAAAGIAFTLWLLSTRSLSQAWALGAIVAAGALLRWRMPATPEPRAAAG